MATSPSNPLLLKIRDIGPVRSADFRIAPLMVLIGPNNAGKSVAATAMHALFHAGPPAFLTSLPGRQMGMRSGVSRSGFLWALRRPSAAIEITERLPQIDFTRDDIKLDNQTIDLLNRVLEDVFAVYAEFAIENLADEFGSAVDDLIRVDADGRQLGAKIELWHQEPEWRFSLTFGGSTPRHSASWDIDWQGVLRRFSSRRDMRSYLSTRSRLFAAEEIVGLFMAEIFSAFPQRSYYLPAARSGILQSHRVIAAALVRASTRAGLEEVAVPRMTGTLADFISALLSMGPHVHGDFEEIADALEATLLDGAIKVDQTRAYPEISYRSGSLELPIYRTSSMVSELAPVILYLRFLLSRGDRLVIEEPEAHLHPGSQIQLAHAISRLVTSGLGITLTTHSDYLLQSISNAIRATSTREPSLFEPLSGPEGLAHDYVTTYLFDRTSRNGTVVRDVRVTAEGGISDDEFAQVSESLYRETVRVDNAVQNR